MNKDLNLLLVLALTVLIAGVPTHVELPHNFYHMVNDKTNVILLMGLCLLISYCNFPLGVMMSIFVFTVMVYGQNHIEGFESNNEEGIPGLEEDPINNMVGDEPLDGPINDVPDVPEDMGEESMNNIAGEPKNNMVNTPDEPLNETKNDTTDSTASFVNEQNLKQDFGKLNERIQENTVTPSEVCDQLTKIVKCPASSEDFNAAYSNDEPINNSTDVEEGFIGRQIREQFQSQKPTGKDYDVVGCRYDLQGNLNNEFVQGPPLSGCNTYDSGASQQIGADFYPINP